MSRRIVWFSCGAASACAAKLAVERYGRNGAVKVVYCDLLSSEHPDNKRFLLDVQNWIGVKVQVIGSSRYLSVDDVFEKTRYMSGPDGARCTVEMKKVPRFEFQRHDDTHMFGFTANETRRIADFEARNHDVSLEWILRDQRVTKQGCFRWLTKVGLRLPKMYLLGYRNNNCLGCVKSTSPGYWNKIRVDFPEVFERRVRQGREIGVRQIEIKKGVRIFLDELTPEMGSVYKGENISCGPECGTGAV